jgi:hypothetical protein
MEIRADIGASLPASLAGKAWLSMSDSRTSSGHPSPLIVVEWLHL